MDLSSYVTGIGHTLEGRSDIIPNSSSGVLYPSAAFSRLPTILTSNSPCFPIQKVNFVGVVSLSGPNPFLLTLFTTLSRSYSMPGIIVSIASFNTSLSSSASRSRLTSPSLFSEGSTLTTLSIFLSISSFPISNLSSMPVIIFSLYASIPFDIGISGTESGDITSSIISFSSVILLSSSMSIPSLLITHLPDISGCLL